MKEAFVIRININLMFEFHSQFTEDFFSTVNATLPHQHSILVIGKALFLEVGKRVG